jgi:hypothetical protein
MGIEHYWIYPPPDYAPPDVAYTLTDAGGNNFLGMETEAGHELFLFETAEKAEAFRAGCYEEPDKVAVKEVPCWGWLNMAARMYGRGEIASVLVDACCVPGKATFRAGRMIQDLEGILLLQGEGTLLCQAWDRRSKR